MDPRHEHLLGINRRQFFNQTCCGIGGAALASLLNPALLAFDERKGSALAATPVAPTATRVIYLVQSGAPSQIDLVGYKPGLGGLNGS